MAALMRDETLIAKCLFSVFCFLFSVFGAAANPGKNYWGHYMLRDQHNANPKAIIASPQGIFWSNPWQYKSLSFQYITFIFPKSSHQLFAARWSVVVLHPPESAALLLYEPIKRLM